jgi:4-amino-4-deoxy-L-arabinose transferase-like glycosyltransferase
MILKATFFVISHYAFILFIGLICYGIGRKLLPSISFHNASENFCFCITLGFGLLSYLILLIGTLSLLYFWPVTAVLAGIFLLCSSVWKELFNRVVDAYRQKSFMIWKPVLLSLLGMTIFLPVFLLPLYPPTAFDSTMYHLAYAKIYSSTHTISITPYIRYPVFPQTNEMLFSLAMLLYDGVAAQLISFTMMMVLSFSLFAFGKRYFSEKTGGLATAVFLSNPLVLWLGASAYIDIGLALFITMASYSLINYFSFKEKQWLIFGALFTGLASGAKYSALFFLFFFGLIICCSGLKERKAKDFIIFLAVGCAVASPWYFRNWYYTGNPVFPFFGQIFGYGSWNSRELTGQIYDLIHAHGTGKNLQSFLLLPWNLAVHQTTFLMEAPLSPIYSFTLPLILFSLRSPSIKILSVVVFSYTLFWFSTSQILRYLIPVVPLLSLTVAASIEHVLSFSVRRAALRKSIVIALLIVMVSLVWIYSTSHLRNEGFPPYTQRLEESYLSQKLPSYPAYDYLNRKRGNTYTVYALFDENMAYFANGTFMGDWFGPGRFERIYSKFHDLRLLHQELQSLGADYLLIRKDKTQIELPSAKAFSVHDFKLVFENDHVMLFERL